MTTAYTYFYPKTEGAGAWCKTRTHAVVVAFAVSTGSWGSDSYWFSGRPWEVGLSSVLWRETPEDCGAYSFWDLSAKKIKQARDPRILAVGLSDNIKMNSRSD